MIDAAPPRGTDRRFALWIIGFLGAVTLVYREPVLGPALTPLTEATSGTVAVLIRSVGIEAVRVDTLIRHPRGFAYEIYYRCTGILPVAFLMFSVIVYPGDVRRKLIALLVGVPALLGLNLVRLVHLFYLGVHHPRTFHFAHSVLWETGIIAAILAAWLVAVRWIDGAALRRGVRPT